MTGRDVQRAKVYRAEGQAFRGIICGRDVERFPDVAAIERFVVKVCSSKRIQERYTRARLIAEDPARRLKIHDGGGSGRGAAEWQPMRGRAWMRLPLMARNREYILHELAHVLAWESEAWHDWRFCEAMLYLVLIVLGREDHDRLKASYKANGVRFRAPRAKRVLTPEQRAKAIERLQAAQHRVPETVAFWGLD